jgi:hypothetical protein
MVVRTLSFGSYPFDFVCQIDVIRDDVGRVVEFMPQSRYSKAAEIPLNRYGLGPFVKFKIPRNYRKSGVYGLTDAEGLRYIGEAADLSARYNNGYGNISPRNCYKGGQETNCRLNALIYQTIANGLLPELWFHETPNYKMIEAELRRELTPEWNRV